VTNIAIILLFVLAILLIYQCLQIEDLRRRPTRGAHRKTFRAMRGPQTQAEAKDTRSTNTNGISGDQSSTPRGQVFSGGWTRTADVHPDYYETLEVSPQASPEVIKRVYRVLIEKYHPDKHPETRRSWAEQMTKNVNEAFAVLSDERKRREFDEQRARQHSV